MAISLLSSSNLYRGKYLISAVNTLAGAHCVQLNTTTFGWNNKPKHLLSYNKL